MTLTRRQTIIGAAATVAAAALPVVAVAVAEVVHAFDEFGNQVAGGRDLMAAAGLPSVTTSAYPHYRKTFTRYDGRWPETAIDGDLFEDVLHNVRWQYCTGGYPGWFFVDKIDWSKPCVKSG
jgi:hypothetical protein